MNERYLRWDSSAQRQLIMIWVAQQLDVSMSELEGAHSRFCGWMAGLRTQSQLDVSSGQHVGLFTKVQAKLLPSCQPYAGLAGQPICPARFSRRCRARGGAGAAAARPVQQAGQTAGGYDATRGNKQSGQQHWAHVALRTCACMQAGAERQPNRTAKLPRSAGPNLSALLPARQAKLVLALVRDLPTTTQVGDALVPPSSALVGLKGAC